MVLFGGAGSGKSWFITQKHILRCLQEPPHRFLFCRKVGRTIRNSVFKMTEDVMRSMGILDRVKVNKTEMSFTFPNGSEILTSGLDDVEKLKSFANPSGIWVEEATEITEDDMTQLDLRMRGPSHSYYQLTLSFNPINELLWLKRVFVDEGKPGAYVLKTTYLDNLKAGKEYAEALKNISDPVMRAIYERGEWGQLRKGLIFPDWDTFDTFPEGTAVRHGLDFGYNDPMVLVKTGIREKELYIEELIYQSAITVQDLIAILDGMGFPKSEPIWADSSQPDSIETLQRAGYAVIAAKKGPGSVVSGIHSVKAMNIHIHRQSVNVQNEARQYKWFETREGAIVDKPIDMFNHGWDAVRYAVHEYIQPAELAFRSTA